MSIDTYKINRNNKVARECITLAMGATSVSQTATEADEVTPGYAFEIVAAEAYATGVTATASVDVQISGTSALSAAITPVAAAPTAGALSATLANVRGSATDTIQAKYTTNASGVVTNGRIRVWIIPQGLNGQNISEP